MIRGTTVRGAALMLGVAWITGACGRRDSYADSTAVAPAGGGADTGVLAATPAAAGGDVVGMSAANIASMIGATNGAEIMDAQIAERNAASSDVKGFARDMIADHRALQKSLDSLAVARTITPQSPPQEDLMVQQHRATMARLDSLHGAAFDRAYMDAQVQAHEKAVADLQRFAREASDADLKALIERAIPKIQQHLDQARRVQAGR